MADVTPIGSKLQAPRYKVRHACSTPSTTAVEAAIACFTIRATSSSATSACTHGPDECGTTTTWTRQYFPDLQFEVIDVHHGDDAVVGEMCIDGTHLGSGPRLRGHLTPLPVPHGHDLRVRRRRLVGARVLLRHGHGGPTAGLSSPFARDSVEPRSGGCEAPVVARSVERRGDHACRHLAAPDVRPPRRRPPRSRGAGTPARSPAATSAPGCRWCHTDGLPVDQHRALGARGRRPSTSRAPQPGAMPRSRRPRQWGMAREVALAPGDDPVHPPAAGVMPGPSSCPCSGRAGFEPEGVTGTETGGCHARGHHGVHTAGA